MWSSSWYRGRYVLTEVERNSSCDPPHGIVVDMSSQKLRGICLVVLLMVSW